MLGFFLIAASPLLAQPLPQSADVGAPAHKGMSRLEGGVYRISASGTNMWGTSDAFHFVHDQFAGDVSIEAKVEWVGEGKNPHRKAGPILRASLDADAPYADFVFHGSGELALQYRKVKGGPTAEIQTTIRPPLVARLERHGDVISAEVSRDGRAWSPVGALTLAMPERIYGGLAVCSHDDTVSETALFRDVKVEARGVVVKRVTESTLEVLDIETKQRQIVRRAKEHFEAPNWSRDNELIYNAGGRLYRIAAGGGPPAAIDTGERIRCNNDHGISPDGKWLAISDGSASRQSQIYILPFGGGIPRLITPQFPSYWHGWSPDGKTLAYCARRNDNFDIYTIPAEGGEEKRLTTAEGLDDGPDYSPDGKYIYFNSVRSGVMRIWRMLADGTDQRMFIEGSDSADWFAHPSPDGKWVVYLSFEKTVEGHPANKDVTLKLVPADGGRPRVIATLFGGQGTINVPSWSADSKRIAFVSYRLVP
ncbi:MAG: PD40 domain-containing protein [Bryobacterales bacterium]|nr:PD40 domain-containing protein [Bryobacterales bacterium]